MGIEGEEGEEEILKIERGREGSIGIEKGGGRKKVKVVLKMK